LAVPVLAALFLRPKAKIPQGEIEFPLYKVVPSTDSTPTGLDMVEKRALETAAATPGFEDGTATLHYLGSTGREFYGPGNPFEPPRGPWWNPYPDPAREQIGPLEIGDTWALIINGDVEPRHVANAAGYEKHLMQDFGIPHEHILVLCSACSVRDGPATPTAVKDALRRLKERGVKRLYLYTTGHGSREMGQSALVLEDYQEMRQVEFAQLALETEAKHLRYFGDQCYSGGFASTLAALAGEGKDVLAMSAATSDTTCDCGRFTPPLLAAYAAGADDRRAFEAASKSAQGAFEPAGLYVSTANAPRMLAFDGLDSEDARDFEGRDLVLKQPARLSRWSGSVVLLDFWAPWCPPCVAELPDLARLHKEFGARGFTVLGVTIDEPDADVLQAMSKALVSYPVLSVPKRPDGYVFRGIPYAQLIGCDGRVLHSYLGLKQAEALRGDILGALASCDEAKRSARAF
jgi:thiol-disulfide isomerase/thioredoxin